VIVVLDEAQAQRELAAGRLACPGCGGRLGPWGHARARPVRHPGGQQSWVRPRRACCAGCGATHVLLAAAVLPGGPTGWSRSGRRCWPPPVAGAPADRRRLGPAARHGAGLVAARPPAGRVAARPGDAAGFRGRPDVRAGRAAPLAAGRRGRGAGAGRSGAHTPVGGAGGLAVAGDRRADRRAAARSPAQRLSVRTVHGVSHARWRRQLDDGDTMMVTKGPCSSPSRVSLSSSSSVSRNTLDQLGPE